MSQQSSKPLSVMHFVLVSVLIIVVVQVGFGIVSWRLLGDNAGTLGDMFGALNTSFSGLAFAGVIYAIVLQSEELKLQRQELMLTRGELSQTAESQRALARFQHEIYHRNRLGNLAAAVAGATELARSPRWSARLSGQIDKGARAHLDRYLKFWRSYAGDVTAALGPSSQTREELDVLFESTVEALESRDWGRFQDFRDDVGEPTELFSRLTSDLLEAMQEEAARADGFRRRIDAADVSQEANQLAT